MPRLSIEKVSSKEVVYVLDMNNLKLVSPPEPMKQLTLDKISFMCKNEG